MDQDADTCRVCGADLSGVERKRGVCNECRADAGEVQK